MHRGFFFRDQTARLIDLSLYQYTVICIRSDFVADQRTSAFKGGRMFKIQRSAVAAAVIAACSTALPGVAMGQADNTLSLEEVVVTARKVGESIQDVPLSIVAFDAEQIEAASITSIDDIATFTPGLHISNYTGDRDDTGLRFRGMDNSSRARDQALSSAFVDGVYLPGSSQWISVNDVERVEVVKGPQSAFFGRATFGGAVNFISKTPGNEWAGDVDLSVGENGRNDLEGSIEGPIIQDRLSFRLSGRFFEYDGGYRNEHPSGGRLGSQTTQSGSLTLYATPTDDLSIKFRSVYSEDDDGPGVFFTTRNDVNNCGPTINPNDPRFFDPADPQFAGVTPRSFYCGTLTTDLIPALGYDTTVDLTTPGSSWPTTEFGLERYVNLNSLTIEYDIGDYSLTSVTGAYNESFELMRDFQGYEPGTLLSFSAYRDETFSQEIRLASPQDQRFRWLLGAYYLDLTYGDRRGGFGCADTSYINCSANALFPGGPPRGIVFFGGIARGAFGGAFGDGTFDADPDREIENIAAFGAVSFDVTEQLTLSLEIRRAEDKLRYEPVTQEGTGTQINLQGTFKSTTPRFIVDYKPNDDTTLYFNYSEGNQPGNFNQEVARINPNTQQTFIDQFGAGPTVPEAELINYEIGWKQTLLDGRAFFNASIYHMDWNDQAFTAFVRDFDTDGDGDVDSDDNFQIDFSGDGESQIQGIDIATSIALNDNWVLGLSYNYNDTELKRFEESNFENVFGTRDASGRELPRSPKNSGVFNASFNMPGPNDGSWFGRLDVIYQDGTYTWVHNLAETGDITNVNLRGGWSNDKYTVALWVQNLTDHDELSAARRFSDVGQGGFGFSSSLPRPREMGINFEARFGHDGM